jgi:ribosomal protein L36
VAVDQCKEHPVATKREQLRMHSLVRAGQHRHQLCCGDAASPNRRHGKDGPCATSGIMHCGHCAAWGQWRINERTHHRCDECRVIKRSRYVRVTDHPKWQVETSALRRARRG